MDITKGLKVWVDADTKAFSAYGPLSQPLNLLFKHQRIPDISYGLHDFLYP